MNRGKKEDFITTARRQYEQQVLSATTPRKSPQSGSQRGYSLTDWQADADDHASCGSDMRSVRSDESEMRQELNVLGVSLDESVIRRMQASLGSDIFSSAIKAAQCLRSGADSVDGDDHQDERSTNDSDSEAKREIDMGYQSYIEDFEGRKDATRSLYAKIKTPMGHLIDTSTTTEGVSAHGTSVSSSTSGGQWDLPVPQNIPSSSTSVSSSSQQVAQENRPLEEQDLDASENSEVPEWARDSEMEEKGGKGSEENEEEKSSDWQRSIQSERASPGRAPQLSSSTSRSRGPGGGRRSKFSSLNKETLKSDTTGGSGAAKGNEHTARSSESNDNPRSPQYKSPNARHLYDSTRVLNPGHATKRLFDSDAAGLEQDPVMQAITDIPSVPESSNHFGIVNSAGPDLSKWSKTHPRNVTTHNSSAVASTAMSSEVPDFKESPLLTYSVQRGIARLDINDHAALRALEDNSNMSLNTSIASQWSDAHQGETSTSLGGYVDRGNSLHRSIGAFEADKVHRPHVVQSYGSIAPPIFDDAIQSISQVAVSTLGLTSPQSHRMPPRPPSPDRYEHEMHLDTGVTLRNGVVYDTDTGGNQVKVARLASSQMNGVDPGDRAELDGLIMDLQYDYAVGSEKFVRRLYDYPENAPKVNIKLIMKRRFAHPEFFQAAIWRCLIGGRGGSQKWGKQHTSRTNDIVYALFQLVYENRKIPGEKERRPCVDLYRFLRMLKTTDKLRAQWRLGGKKAVEEFMVRCNLHRKENGSTNVPLPASGKYMSSFKKEIEHVGIAPAYQGSTKAGHTISDPFRYCSGLPSGRQPNEKIDNGSSSCEVVLDSIPADPNTFRNDSRDFTKGPTEESKKNARLMSFQHSRAVDGAQNVASCNSRRVRELIHQGKAGQSQTDAIPTTRSTHGTLNNQDGDMVLSFNKNQSLQKSRSDGEEDGGKEKRSSSTRIERFTERLINAETVASALHGREDPWGRETFWKSKSDHETESQKYKQRTHSHGIFTEKEIEESNRSGEAKKYREHIKEMANARQIPKVSNKRGAGYLSTREFMKQNNCGVAALLGGFSSTGS